MGLGLLLTCHGTVQAQVDMNDDYYAGFAQGTYYGLLLAGEDYDVSWCMRGELAYQGKDMGLGADFQRAMENILGKCRTDYGKPESQPADKKDGER